MGSLFGSIFKGVFLTVLVMIFVYGGIYFLLTDNKPRNLKELNATIKNIVNVKQNIKNMYSKSYNQVEILKAGTNDEMVDENAKKIGRAAQDEKQMMEQADQVDQDFKAPTSDNIQSATAELKPKPIEKIDRSGTTTIDIDLSKTTAQKK